MPSANGRRAEPPKGVSVVGSVGDESNPEVECREGLDDVVEVSGHGAEVCGDQLVPVVALSKMTVLRELQQTQRSAVVKSNRPGTDRRDGEVELGNDVEQLAVELEPL